MTVGLRMWVEAEISVAGIREDNGLRVGPCLWMAELGQAGLQGGEALGDGGGDWGGGGSGGSGGSRGGQAPALSVCLAVGKDGVLSLSRSLHPQEPRNPLEQNQVHLRGTKTDK